MNSFVLTAQSAWETLQICDRQARKDYAKCDRFARTIYAILSSEEARRWYRITWNCIVLACMAVVYLGMVCREWCDNYVESCLPDEVEESDEDVAIARAISRLFAEVRVIVRKIEASVAIVQSALENLRSQMRLQWGIIEA